MFDVQAKPSAMTAIRTASAIYIPDFPGKQHGARRPFFLNSPDRHWKLPVLARSSAPVDAFSLFVRCQL